MGVGAGLVAVHQIDKVTFKSQHPKHSGSPTNYLKVAQYLAVVAEGEVQSFFLLVLPAARHTIHPVAAECRGFSFLVSIHW